MPTVLIMCPTFDHAETLFASTASVRAQNLQDWELVVISDGAPDRTTEIMTSISEADPKFLCQVSPHTARYQPVI